ncbi:MAG TPA: glycerol-3-phosphate 1-O-acyltransferase PlsY [Burkholderiaceae bacterium]|nr:glycerol-3-phosphate 1-O-acyltransferase PlsY [Burkholderiaceae bacterium]
MESLASLAAVALAYLIGSLSFAVVVSRAMGLADPRSYGSKNPGATNVLRSGNKAAAVLTLLGDAAKGWLAVWLALRFGPRVGVGEFGVAAVAVAVFVGHLYPVFFGFKGGKGVATAAGVVLALNPWLALATALTWVIIAGFFRYSSLASIAAAVFAAFYSAFGWGFDERFLALVAIAGLIVYRHRANIRNLLAGKERRIGQKAPDALHAGH